MSNGNPPGDDFFKMLFSSTGDYADYGYTPKVDKDEPDESNDEKNMSFDWNNIEASELANIGDGLSTMAAGIGDLFLV